MCSMHWSGGDKFDPAFGLVNDPVKSRSNLVKALRTLGNVSRTRFWVFLGILDPSRVRNGLVKPRSNLVNSWSNLINLGQTWSTLGKFGRISGNAPQAPFWGYLTWRALVGSGRLGLGYLVLHACIRENPGGKNGVMTGCDCYFGSVWNLLSLCNTSRECSVIYPREKGEATTLCLLQKYFFGPYLLLFNLGWSWVTWDWFDHIVVSPLCNVLVGFI